MNSVKVPERHDRVYKDECMFSFDTPETPTGLYTSMTTWQSFGADYVDADFQRNGNRLYLKQVWKRVMKPEALLPENETTAKTAPSKMAIGVEGGFNLDGKKYEIRAVNYIVVFPERVEIKLPSEDIPTIVSMAADAIIKHDGFKRSQQVAAAWEEADWKESKYAKELPQLDNGKKISPDPKTWRCGESGITENLWLNLSTGYIGSGRKNWDGSGGTGAALTHFEETGRKYPLAVKLGTITPQGADVFSYAPDENDMVIDPYLADHLAHWGINMQQQTKTEKTMTEMTIELNNNYQFSRITESGSELVPLHGPGYVGLNNLGNSCYMASVMQILFSIPQIASRYHVMSESVISSSPPDPAEDLLTMMSKMAVGLLSDRYTKPIPAYERANDSADLLRLSSSKTEEAYGSITPFMFKNLIGKGHREFSSTRQQDACEYFQYFLDKIERAERSGRARFGGSEEGQDFLMTPVLFSYEAEERIEDTQTSMVKYITRSDNLLSLPIDTDAAINKEQYHEFEEQRSKRQKLGDELTPVQLQVPLSACLAAYVQSETIKDFTSPQTGQKGTALKRTRMKTFPEYLAIHLKRYYVAEDWTPRKLDVSVPMPEELNLSDLRGVGAVEGEVLMPQETTSPAGEKETTEFVPDPAIVSQLMGMGFSENGCKRAAIATKNSSAEACMEWVFAHMEDPDFNDPPVPTNGREKEADDEFPSEAISSLTAMGFTDAQARAALKTSGGSLERAADWLFSHTDDLDAAVREVEESHSTQPEGGSEGGGGVTSLLDGEPKYELLGFASHLGPNTSCGHYVAHIKKEGRFVLYNDEKVAVSQSPPTDLGFLYVYRRKTA